MQALVKLTEGDASDLSQGGTLAVSLEPAGGSPTGTATGPILYVGPVLPAADAREP
jgi:anti-sigma-K factor RskA